MQTAELKAQLKTGQLSGVYILCGEEDFLKRYYLNQIRRTLLPDPSLDAFNHVVGEGERIDLPYLTDAREAPPMMAERKLLEWHLGDFNAMREEERTRFAAYCEASSAYPETVTVFMVDAGQLDVGTLPRRPSRLYTALSQCASVLYFERSGEAALCQWIARHFAHEGVAAQPQIPSLMLQRCGRSMDVLSGEIDKLVAYVRAQGRGEILPADVALVCAPTSESDAFGLSNAILEGDAARAYACLRDMQLRRVDPAMAIASLARIYAELVTVSQLVAEGMQAPAVAKCMKMHEYKATLYVRCVKRREEEWWGQALAQCCSLDTAYKSGRGAGDYLAVELLLARLLAPQEPAAPASPVRGTATAKENGTRVF